VPNSAEFGASGLRRRLLSQTLRHTLSIFNSNYLIAGGRRMLASAAVAAIVASGAIGGSIMSASTQAIAAAVDTSSSIAHQVG
jgi:hypothetical protein